MAFRRERGRGRRGGQHPCKQEEIFMPLFPEIKEYPTINLKDIDKELMTLCSWSNDLHNFWISSSYHLDDPAKTYGGKRRRPLSDFIKMSDEYVPAEFLRKNVNARLENKKVRWDPKSNLERLYLFGTMDRAPQGDQDGEDDEDDEEDDEDEEEDDALKEEEDESDCGCSCKGIIYDHESEDDYNLNEDLGDDDRYY
ncbi:hypothetical protein Tco_0605938 [Tanacetum coccineum]